MTSGQFVGRDCVALSGYDAFAAFRANRILVSVFRDVSYVRVLHSGLRSAFADALQSFHARGRRTELVCRYISSEVNRRL